ncbi:MAG: hypothetical protein H0V88_01150 [Pyrinomonadaceae bacterium]|nr:hypothetical protein [Pyrinomonadaceae bacterium]
MNTNQTQKQALSRNLQQTRRQRQAMSHAAGRNVLSHLLVVFSFLLVFVLASSFSCARRQPVQETVTTDARSTQVNSTPVTLARPPQLPARDADVEAAGDFIAAAVTHLRKHRNTAALASLSGAKAAAARAIRNNPQKKTLCDRLHESLKNIETAESTIERGKPDDAVRQLSRIDDALDHISQLD